VSEPSSRAERVEEVVPGVWSWSVDDDRIDFVSTAHAVAGDEGIVLVDPLPLAPEALGGLGEVTAICLTAGTHQRSAWRYRRELGARVYAPALSRLIEEEPDERYGDGDELPGSLRAVFTPGAGTTQHTFLLAREGGVAFVPDLLAHTPERGLRIVSDRYLHDPAETRRSIRKLLELPFSVLCLDHGEPLTEDPKGAIRALLERDQSRS
jgi:glyoxylase-like metal-dependent hydrolase (beta-lactamase superfamily II)